MEKNLERKLHNSDERKKMKKSKETSEEEFREEFRGSIYLKQVSEFEVQIQRRHSKNRLQVDI